MFSYLSNSSFSRLTVYCSSSYGYGIRIAKQGTHVFLIITISRPVVVVTPVNFGVYKPVSQTGKTNKSWEVIPQNELNLKIQEKEIQGEINESPNEL